MKLSEAIRLGAMIRPKADGWFFLDGASCAQGAALEACGTPYDDDFTAQLNFHFTVQLLWPWAGQREACCPVCDRQQSVKGIIAHLNNRSGHSWTREAIADWVATVEPADPVVATSLDGDSQRSSVDAVDPVLTNSRGGSTRA